MSQKMIGVVLWSHRTEHKAVIWCEDHGELAFWHEPDNGLDGGVGFSVGDLVAFDIHDGDNLRHASNPHRLEEKKFFGLVETLVSADLRPAGGQSCADQMGRVIAFRDAQRPERNVA